MFFHVSGKLLGDSLAKSIDDGGVKTSLHMRGEDRPGRTLEGTFGDEINLDNLNLGLHRNIWIAKQLMNTTNRISDLGATLNNILIRK